ncbi:MAG: hypothetical protein ACJAY8_000551 [Sphingobacteriales bacterium]|jgi:uncharacterized protein YndB with AHSA1/START domain
MEKFKLEFLVHCSPSILFNMISTPSGLSEWFSDDVNIKKEKYTFIWNDSQEEATLLKEKKGEYIRFHWDEHEDQETYFEFRIKVDELTKEVALLVTDFCDEEDIEETQLLWENQINDLKHVVGS